MQSRHLFYMILTFSEILVIKYLFEIFIYNYLLTRLFIHFQHCVIFQTYIDNVRDRLFIF